MNERREEEKNYNDLFLPAPGILDEGVVLLDQAGTVLDEETKKRAAARASLKPKNDGVVAGIVLALQEVIVEIGSVLGVDVDETTVGRCDRWESASW